MTLEAIRSDEILSLVDTKRGTVDRRIFSDQAIYDLEMERIFARAWLFMCHDSQIPNPGDFFMSFMGEDRVIVVRDNEGNPQVLVNSCRHRGNAVCRAEEGHATSFMCTYHGWTYDLRGALVGVPGFKEVYHEELDRESWGLIKAAQVDSYKGFIFANMDEAAPNLQDYLGDVGRLCLNHLALHGDNQIVPGIQKYNIPCNWKFATDNVWDFYHRVTHISAHLTADFRYKGVDSSKRRATAIRVDFDSRHLVFPGEYGHVMAGAARGQGTVRQMVDAGEDAWRETAEAKAELGRMGIQAGGHPHVFPNMWITGNQIWVRMPKGPAQTELWSFLLLDKNMSDERRSDALIRAQHTFGPGGLWEQDDGENWAQSTRGMVGSVSKRFPLNYAMNIGHGQVIKEEDSPAYVEGKVTEHPQLWHYRSWAEWMSAESWDELRKNHSKPEGLL